MCIRVEDLSFKTSWTGLCVGDIPNTAAHDIPLISDDNPKDTLAMAFLAALPCRLGWLSA